MIPVLIGIIAFIVLFALLAAGLQIGFGMGLVGFIGFWLIVSGPAALVKLATTPFDVVSSYSLATLPLFLLMAHVLFASGIGRDLFNLASKWLGPQPGGLAIATIAGCAGFAAVSASSLATAATFGLVALPEMKKYKYSPQLATGCIAAGGTIGSLIPPSGMLIIYGILTEQSIGKLFIGGFVPGILEAVFYIVTIYMICTWKPSLGPRGPKYSLREKVAAFKGCGEIILLIILVLGGLLIGWFTATEAGAVGAFGAIVFSLIRKRLTWHTFKEAVIETMKATGMIYGILIGAFIFNYFVAVTTIPMGISEWVGGLHLPAVAIMVVIMAVYFFLGMFLDAAAMQVLTIPIFFPVVMDLGFDPIWFGIILVRALEIAMITPPVGMNVYVLAGVAPDIPMTSIFRGIFPFVIADIFHVALLFLAPQVVLFLPNLMR